MNQFFNASSGKRALSFRLAMTALICFAAAPAVARQCPRGQYLRVSKGICVSKADARKHLGTSHGPARSGDGASEGKAVISEASTAYAPVKGSSFSALDAVENPKATKASPTNAPHSPYGELTIETFAKH
jgi:hypothetical protein